MSYDPDSGGQGGYTEPTGTDPGMGGGVVVNDSLSLPGSAGLDKLGMPSLTPAQIGAFLTSGGALALAAGLHVSQDVFNHIADVVQTGVPTLIAADFGLRWNRARHAPRIALANSVAAGTISPQALVNAAAAPQISVGMGATNGTQSDVKADTAVVQADTAVVADPSADPQVIAALAPTETNGHDPDLVDDPSIPDDAPPLGSDTAADEDHATDTGLSAAEQAALANSQQEQPQADDDPDRGGDATLVMPTSVPPINDPDEATDVGADDEGGVLVQE